MAEENAIPLVASPWKLKGSVYAFACWTKVDAAGNLPDVAYSPLEHASSFASPEGGRPIGGLSMIQIIRYTESPAGPYDELLISPGSFEYTVEDKNGKRVRKRHLRITRAYVSQKITNWNGRTNWNIPKHLAKFDWVTSDDGQISVTVFPHDTTDDPKESSPSTTPFFQASFKPTSYLPSFPLSFKVLNSIGIINTTLVHPPLPAGSGSQGELPGTDRWCAVSPNLWSRKTSLGWFDIRQGDAQDSIGPTNDNFWPGLGRWQLGYVMNDCEVDFPDGKYWDPPKSTN
ncbi:hypothetical protein V2G26_001728 [Clonostachys chloroleuca]